MMTSFEYSYARARIKTEDAAIEAGHVAISVDHLHAHPHRGPLLRSALEDLEREANTTAEAWQRTADKISGMLIEIEAAAR